MNQIKIGSFLKELRKESGFTQEQFSEQLNVSRRTVSRWETGSNMPDLDILMEISDFYGVDIRELLDGERKGEKMDKELKETIIKVADYSNEEKAKLTRRMHFLFIAGMVSFIIYFITLFAGPEETSHLFNFLQGVSLGISFGMVIVGVIMTSKNAEKIRAFKMRLLHKQG